MAIEFKEEPIWITDYWCPGIQRWVDCSDPCPDGRAHVRRSRYKTITRITGDNPQEVKDYFLNRIRRPISRGCRT